MQTVLHVHTYIVTHDHFIDIVYIFILSISKCLGESEVPTPCMKPDSMCFLSGVLYMCIPLQHQHQVFLHTIHTPHLKTYHPDEV